MAATQIGTDLIVGVGTTMTSYVVVSRKLGDAEVNMSDILDENGVLITRIVKQTMVKQSCELIAKSGAAPATDFVKGAICTVAPFGSYYIDDVSIDYTDDALKVSVSGTLIGITA